MRQAPTFGAIPSANELKKLEEKEIDKAEWRDDTVSGLLQRDALLRLNRLEQADPDKADAVKAELFRMANGSKAKQTPFSDAVGGPSALKKGSVTDDQLKALIQAVDASAVATAAAGSRGIKLNGRRLGDDSDSDIDLSDL